MSDLQFILYQKTRNWFARYIIEENDTEALHVEAVPGSGAGAGKQLSTYTLRAVAVLTSPPARVDH